MCWMAADEAAGPDLMGWLSFIKLPNIDIGHVTINIYDPAADITHGVLTLQLLPFYFYLVFQPAEFAINAACLPGFVRGRERKRPVSLQPICPRWLDVRFIRVKVQVWHWKTQVFERTQALRHQARAGVIFIHPPALCLCVVSAAGASAASSAVHISYFCKSPLLVPCSVERACTWPTQACLRKLGRS